MNEINNPHDAFFKRNFGDIEIAKDFLRNYLPEKVAQAIDLEHIEKENGSYVDEEFQNMQSDLLWKTKINNHEGYIYILFEHKSYKDKKVIFQLLKYILKIWEEKYDKTKNKIPIIIPIVVYHGETIWNIETNLIKLIEGNKDIPEEIKRYIPSYEYEVYDFSPKSKSKITGEAYTRLVIEVMRSAFGLTPSYWRINKEILLFHKNGFGIKKIIIIRKDSTKFTRCHIIQRTVWS